MEIDKRRGPQPAEEEGGLPASGGVQAPERPLTGEERILEAAGRILETYKEAFEELAK